MRLDQEIAEDVIQRNRIRENDMESAYAATEYELGVSIDFDQFRRIAANPLHYLPRLPGPEVARRLQIHPSHVRTLRTRYGLKIGQRVGLRTLLYSEADVTTIREWQSTHTRGPKKGS